MTFDPSSYYINFFINKKINKCKSLVAIPLIKTKYLKTPKVHKNQLTTNTFISILVLVFLN